MAQTGAATVRKGNGKTETWVTGQPTAIRGQAFQGSDAVPPWRSPAAERSPGLGTSGQIPETPAPLSAELAASAALPHCAAANSFQVRTAEGAQPPLASTTSGMN